MTGIGRPEASEYAPFFAGYVALVAGDAPVPVLEAQARTVAETFTSVGDESAGFRYAPGKWSVREVLGHCIDTERVFTYRALAFARGEQAPLPRFDEDAYAANAGHDGIPLEELVAEFGHVRAATVAMLRHLPAAAWSRVGAASGNAISVRALAFIMAGHVQHHLGILRDRYGVGHAG